jgi:hypothetical protein
MRRAPVFLQGSLRSASAASTSTQRSEFRLGHFIALKPLMAAEAVPFVVQARHWVTQASHFSASGRT